MAEADEELPRANAGEGLNPKEEAGSRTESKTVESVAPDAIEPALVDEDIYDAEPLPVKGSASKKKKEAPLQGEEVPIEAAPPPPYSGPAAAEAKKKPFWKKRWFLLLAVGVLIAVIAIVAIVLGVVLSRKHGSTTTESSPPSAGGNTPSGTTPSSSPLPTAPSQPGDASAPLNNTAIAAVNILDFGAQITDNGYSSFVKIFFQDEDLYLSEKSSTNGSSSWDLTNSGNRIMQAMNGTPIAAVSNPAESANELPIRVVFVNTAGILADIYQDIYGGSWTNGTLADREYRPYLSEAFGDTSRGLAASWCDGEDLTLFVQASDLTIDAFELQETSSTSAWSPISGNFGNIKAVSSVDNIASTCWFDGLGVPPLFVNAYNGIEATGSLYTWYNNTNTSVTFPSKTASLYRPNTPIGAVFGNIGSASTTSTGYGLVLFYPLPTNLEYVTPSPSLHYIIADPYPASTLNWTGAVDVDTGIVPYALGAKALYDAQEDEGQAPGLSVDQGVDSSMPRSWQPLLMQGLSTEAGTVIVIYQTAQGGIKVTDVIGGTKGGSFDVIVP